MVNSEIIPALAFSNFIIPALVCSNAERDRTLMRMRESMLTQAQVLESISCGQEMIYHYDLSLALESGYEQMAECRKLYEETLSLFN